MKLINCFGNGKSGLIQSLLLDQETEPAPFIIGGQTINASDNTFIGDRCFTAFLIGISPCGIIWHIFIHDIGQVEISTLIDPGGDASGIALRIYDDIGQITAGDHQIKISGFFPEGGDDEIELDAR